MRPFIKTILIFTLLYLSTSCSNDFLNENLSQSSIPVGLSNIYISPNWQSSDYIFKLPSNNADYKIVSKPSWLNIDSVKGHLSDSLAIIKCSAKKNSAFNKVGIYLDFMTVKSNGNDYKVPVSYITEGNPKIQVQSPLNLYIDNPILPIQNNGEGILIWKIKSMPDWLVIDSAKLESKGLYISPYTSYNIPLLIKPGKVYTGSLAGTIALYTNDKEHSIVTISVSVNLGTPKLSIGTNTIYFSYTEKNKTLTFSNYGNGCLIWEFKNIPEWLTITPSSGISSYFSNSNVTFSCDRTKMSPGQNSATVSLITNDSSYPNYSINVIVYAPGSSENIRAIDGNVTDAVFNKNTNILYYVTSNPNSFVAYDVVGRTVLNKIPLSKAPTSLAISEDWTKAAVGQNGFLTAINLSSNTVTSVYSLNCSVYDIAWAENDWFCYTQNGGDFSGLHWINTANGALYDDPETYSLDGSTIIKKVPNQPYLIATRGSTSPSGFFAYDIAKRSKKSYAHMDLTNFWFAENGDYIFGKNLSVYRTTSSTQSTDKFNATINAISKINTGTQSYYGLQYIYNSNNYLWVLQKNSYSSDLPTSLYQIEDNDYNFVNKYNYDLMYQPNAQTNPFDVNANYVFTNKEETEIVVLCKGISNNFWIMQFIHVK